MAGAASGVLASAGIGLPSNRGYTAVMLVLGVMDLRVMAIATVVITLERAAPGAPGILSGLSRLRRAGLPRIW